MPRVRITNRYQKLSGSNLLGKFRFIIASITDNPNFVSPNPSILSLNTLANEFEEAITEASNRSKYARLVAREKRKEVMNHLYILTNYVLRIAKGNKLVAASSGFDIAKQRSAPASLEKPTGLVLTDGPNAGELKLVFKKVKNARSYAYEVAEDTGTGKLQWRSTYGTVRQASFTQLESGKKYWVRVAALGTNKQAVYSDAVCRITQ